MKQIRNILIVAVLLSTAITTTAYNGNRNGNRSNNAEQTSCISALPGLTTIQADKITAMENAHQETMEAFRTERRSTADVKMKEEIRAKMILKRNDHQNQVKELLTDDQQTAYAQLHETGQQNFSRKVQGPGQGYGNGRNSQGPRGNKVTTSANGKGKNQRNNCRQ